MSDRINKLQVELLDASERLHEAEIEAGVRPSYLVTTHQEAAYQRHELHAMQGALRELVQAMLFDEREQLWKLDPRMIEITRNQVYRRIISDMLRRQREIQLAGPEEESLADFDRRCQHEQDGRDGYIERMLDDD